MAERKAGRPGPCQYLGLDLAGAKNQKTALAAIEYFPREGKAFLLDIDDGIGPYEAHDGKRTGDEALLEIIAGYSSGCVPAVATMGVDAPMRLPPCLSCARKKCKPAFCPEPAVRWMRETVRHAKGIPKPKDFTPYTQRPAELWIRYHLFPRLGPGLRFDIDETLGGSRAPLAARMLFLRKHLEGIRLIETLPKLSIAVLERILDLPSRYFSTHRHLERGTHSRGMILEKLSKQGGIFIYERDMKKLCGSLSCFDAFMCAYTALLFGLGQCDNIPKGFPVSSGWIHYPAPGQHRVDR